MPSPAGGSGLAALGEKAAAVRIAYRVPDLRTPAVRARYAGKRTTVIGSGASAFTALACLAGLAKSGDGAGTKSVWILRRNISGSADLPQVPLQPRRTTSIAKPFSPWSGSAEEAHLLRPCSSDPGAIRNFDTE